MSIREIRDLTSEELRVRETELRQELFNLRFQHATRQLENTARIPAVKKEIARVLTVLRERESVEAREA